MGELNERLWGVVSERGREAAGLTYGEAIETELRLKAGKISGLCIITDSAASRLPPAKKREDASAANADNDVSGDARRTSKRKGAA